MRVALRNPLRHPALTWAVMVSVSVCGCAALDPSSNQEQRLGRFGNQAQREAALGARWRGQSYESLLKALGPPRSMYFIPGERPLLSLALVYGRDDDTAACVDAFTIVRNEDTGAWWVTEYFCR
jgi:hypothetical protein